MKENITLTPIYNFAKRKYKGAVALMSVLFVTSILTVGGVILVLTTVDLSKNILNQSNFVIAEQNILICKEEGLRKLKFNRLLNTEFNLVIDENSSCTGIISEIGPAPTDKQMQIDSNYKNSYHSSTFKIDTATSPIVVNKTQ